MLLAFISLQLLNATVSLTGDHMRSTSFFASCKTIIFKLPPIPSASVHKATRPKALCYQVLPFLPTYVSHQIQALTRQLDALRHRINNFFHASTDHPDMVLPRHRFLFTSRTLEDRLLSSYDIMATWLRLVDEAIQVLHHHTTSLREAAQRFFPQPHEADSDSDSTYTFVSSDTDAVLSLAPTVTTEASTNSSSPSTTGSSSTMKGGEDASTISYDNDTLSLNSLLSIDSSSSDVKPTSVASDDPDFSDSTSPVRDSPPIQFPNSASL
jgi:hypothetical protein